MRISVSGSSAALYLSISQAGTIPSEFNDTEPDMEELESHTSKEAAWRTLPASRLRTLFSLVLLGAAAGMLLEPH
jgi:hypothetical protein